MNAGRNWSSSRGVAYAQTIAGALNLKLDADNPADRKKLRRAVLDLVAGRKMPKQKGHAWNSLVLFVNLVSAVSRGRNYRRLVLGSKLLN
jgi:hypothetical protein